VGFKLLEHWFYFRINKFKDGTFDFIYRRLKRNWENTWNCNWIHVGSAKWKDESGIIQVGSAKWKDEWDNTGGVRQVKGWVG